MLTLRRDGPALDPSPISPSLSACSSELQVPSTHPSQHCPSPSMSPRSKSSSKGTASSSKRTSLDEKTVAQALETARESDEGAQDAQVCAILEDALDKIWNKIQARPDSYVMNQTEMAVFTYYQYSFTGNDVAAAARKRFWDNVGR